MSLFKRSPAPLERRQAFPEPIIAPFPGASGNWQSGFGGGPTIDSALQVGAVWACVRLLCDTVSMMPVNAFTMVGTVRKPLATVPALLLKPHVDATMPDWVYMLLTSLLLRGNAYGRIVQRDSTGYPVQIELLDPDKVISRVGADGRLIYRVGNDDLAKDQVLHVRGYRLPGFHLGMSPIKYAARTIQTEHAVQEFAYGFFADGAHPSSILYSDEEFNPEQAREIKTRFMAAVQGREPSVLTGGLKYQQIQVSPEESQFLATKKYTVPEVARLFGVPPEMIAGEAGNSMSYSNREQRSLDYLTYAVQPWLTRIETALSELLPGSKHVRFDTSVLLRTDIETMYKATSIGIASHQLLVDEARAMFDRAPMTAAEKVESDLVPMTVSPTGRPLSLPGTAPAGEGEAPPPEPEASPTP